MTEEPTERRDRRPPQGVPRRVARCTRKSFRFRRSATASPQLPDREAHGLCIRLSGRLGNHALIIENELTAAPYAQSGARAYSQGVRLAERRHHLADRLETIHRSQEQYRDLTSMDLPTAEFPRHYYLGLACGPGIPLAPAGPRYLFYWMKLRGR